jgi:methylmalonyl-CoA carboxyltransferase large subunit
MENRTASREQVLDSIADLRAEMTELRERVATLEAAARTSSSIGGEGLSEELILTITAAVAAYLGVKAHIRQIRLLDSPSWALQGRATIQASHALSIRHS